MNMSENLEFVSSMKDQMAMVVADGVPVCKVRRLDHARGVEVCRFEDKSVNVWSTLYKQFILDQNVKDVRISRDGDAPVLWVRDFDGHTWFINAYGQVL